LINNLECNIQISDDVGHVKLRGSITEDSVLDEIKKVKTSTIQFDFKDIEVINSCGIREWIKLLKNNFQLSIIEYINCPVNVVEQIGMVVGFLPANGEVISLFAPYFNPTSDEEVILLLNKDEFKEGKAPEKSDASGQLLEFDAFEEEYFSFLK
jgi:hypothetical protein